MLDIWNFAAAAAPALWQRTKSPLAVNRPPGREGLGREGRRIILELAERKRCDAHDLDVIVSEIVVLREARSRRRNQHERKPQGEYRLAELPYWHGFHGLNGARCRSRTVRVCVGAVRVRSLR